MTVETAYRRIKAYFSEPDAKFGFDSETAQCQYRAFDHDTGEYRKCAVGVLIPDKKVFSIDDLEDMTPTELVHEGIINGHMTVEQKDTLAAFLVAAQEQHDTHAIGKQYFPSEGRVVSHFIVKEQTIPAFLRSLDAVATEYGVTV